MLVTFELLLVESSKKVCPFCGKRYVPNKSHYSDQKFCSKECYYKSKELTIKKVCPVCHKEFVGVKGHMRRQKYCSLECFKVAMTGELSCHWRGGDSKRKRCDSKYKEWSLAVKVRDEFTCQECGRVGGSVRSHHIRSWTTFPLLRYEVSNGVTLCKGCHERVHKVQGKGGIVLVNVIGG